MSVKTETTRQTDDTLKKSSSAAVVVYRGEVVESTHQASIAVVDGEGQLTHYFGEPEQLVQTRSSIKAFQSIPLHTSGAAERFGFSGEEFALMCASHNGSDEHRRVALSILTKAGLTADALQCGAHLPISMRINNRYPTQGEDTDPLRHNCSGKHSGFLALAVHLGQNPATYLEPTGEVQSRVRAALAHCCDVDEISLKPAIDGCSAPNYAVPLVNLAIGFMRFANAKSDNVKIRSALSVIRAAVYEHPEMVSGEKRLDLDLARSFPGNVVCKVGAEGVEGIGFQHPSMGIAIKIHDGNERAQGPIIVSTLKQLGLVRNISDFPLLKPYEEPVVRNYRKLETGRIAAVFNLRCA